MKKLLVAISFLLVAATLMVMPAFGAKSVDVDDLKWNVGQPIHAVEDATAKAPVIDAAIGKNEYTYKYTYEEPLYMTDRDNFDNANPRATKILPDDEYTEWVSDYIELYFSYDEEYIYIGVYDKMFYQSPKARGYDTTYYLYLGFNMNDPSKAIRLVSNGGGNATGSSNRTVVDGVTYNHCVESKGTGTGNGSDSRGYVTIMEHKLRKSDIVKISNATCGTDFVELPNTFYINVTMRQYNGSPADGSSRYGIETFATWFGKKLTNTDKLTLGTKWNNVPAIVVLGAEAEAEETTTEVATTEPVTTEPVVTEPATTEPATTEPATTEPVETTPVETHPVDTESDTVAETEPAKGGCGSAISAMSVALVAVIGAGALVVSKKKED